VLVPIREESIHEEGVIAVGWTLRGRCHNPALSGAVLKSRRPGRSAAESISKSKSWIVFRLPLLGAKFIYLPCLPSTCPAL
jgi:hypothetical protein